MKWDAKLFELNQKWGAKVGTTTTWKKWNNLFEKRKKTTVKRMFIFTMANNYARKLFISCGNRSINQPTTRKDKRGFKHLDKPIVTNSREEFLPLSWGLLPYKLCRFQIGMTTIPWENGTKKYMLKLRTLFGFGVENSYDIIIVLSK